MTQAKHTAGPWMVSHRGTSIVCANEKIGGEAKLFDVRGWGYLTGTGHGGLGLDEGTATQIQLANANLAAAAPDMLAALKELRDEEPWVPSDILDRICAVIAKAEGRA